MSKKSLGARVRQITGFFALCTVAGTALAEPISVTATCSLRSLEAATPVCDLHYIVSDGFQPPSTARLGQVRVDGKLVNQLVDDTANPVPSAVSFISGTVVVACGATHTVAARFAAAGNPSSAYVNSGTNPGIKCPTGP